MSACNDSEGERPSQKDGIVTFSGDVESLTRVTDNTWDSGDAIGIYMIDAGQALADASVKAANKQYTTNGSGDFTPASISADGIKLPDASNVDFIAYYPYTASVTAAYTIPVDVAVQTQPAKIDLLYSNDATGVAPATPSVALGFEHVMSKIVFNVTDETGASALNSFTVKLNGFPTKADFSLVDATFGGAASVADIAMVTSATGNAGTASAIIIPVGTGTYKAEFTTAAGVLEHEFKATDDFESGKQYNYNVKITADGQLVVSSSNITPWTEDNTRDDIILDAGDGGTTTPPGPGPGTGDYYSTGTLASWDFDTYGWTNAASTYDKDTPIYASGASDLLGQSAYVTAVGGSDNGKVAYGYTATASYAAIITRGWVSTELEDHSWLFSLPLSKELQSGLKILVTFGVYASGTAPANYVCEISTDKINWASIGTYSITTASTVTPVDISYTLTADITSNDLYLRLRASDTQNVSNNGNYATTGTTRIGDVIIKYE